MCTGPSCTGATAAVATAAVATAKVDTILGPKFVLLMGSAAHLLRNPCNVWLTLGDALTPRHPDAPTYLGA